MGQPVIQTSFAAGELSPSLWARTDLEKYHVGAALMRNFFVDYRGGASNRAGTSYIGECINSILNNRLIPFTFSTLQTYALLFGDRTMRVIMNGGLVLEPSFAVAAISQAAPCVLSVPGHDFSNGDTVELSSVLGMTQLNNREFLVANSSVGVFSLTDLAGAPVDTRALLPYSGGGTVARVYTLTTPYAAADLGLLKYTQSADVMTLTHNSYPAYQLTRTQHWAWTLTEITYTSVTPSPTGVAAASVIGAPTYVVGDATNANPGVFSAGGNNLISGQVITFNVAPGGMTQLNGHTYFAENPTADGNFTIADASGNTVDTTGFGVWTSGTVSVSPTVYRYVVTAIGANGLTESLPSAVASTSGAAMSATPSAQNVITWSGQTGATMFNIYRTPENTGGAPVPGALFGFVGSMTAQAGTNSFIDNNISPDFTNCPPQGDNPFANGNNPGCSTYYQQRQVFGGMVNQPDGMSLSKSGDFLNMDYSSPSKPDDAIQVTIASQQVNAIKHLLPMTSLIALTASGAWRVDGGAQSSAITPSNFDAVPQAYNGCSDVPPIVINYDILYVQAKGATVRDLSYNFYVNIYTGTDMTVLSKHLFAGHQIVEWAYSEEPFKVIWAVREDGVLLSFTYIKEQDVYAWCRHDTLGLFKSVCSISEGNENAVYLVALRYLNGRYVQTVERMASREIGGDPSIGIPADLTRAWFVDCGRSYPPFNPAATLYPSALTGTPGITSVHLVFGGQNYTNPSVVDAGGSGASFACTVVDGVITNIIALTPGIVTARVMLQISDPTGTGAVASGIVQNLVTMDSDAQIFTADDVGASLRVNGGTGTVTAVNSATQIVVNVIAPLTSPWPAAAGTWSMTQPVSMLSGLDHLNGSAVAILADGNVQPQQVVKNGAVTLQHAASSIVVGLPYQAQLQSLYLDVPGGMTIQGKRKKANAATVRMLSSRGMKVGQTWDTLHEFKERNTQPMGHAIQLITGDERINFDSRYDIPGQICIQQDNPLPCTVLGIIPEVTVGDTQQ